MHVAHRVLFVRQNLLKPNIELVVSGKLPVDDYRKVFNWSVTTQQKYIAVGWFREPMHANSQQPSSTAVVLGLTIA